MAYARYPNLRNYKKRCELETLIFNLRKQKKAQAIADDTAWEKAFNAGASEAELDAIEAAEDARRDKINAKIEAVMTIQASLEFPATKNQWFQRSYPKKELALTTSRTDSTSAFFNTANATQAKTDQQLSTAAELATISSPLILQSVVSG